MINTTYTKLEDDPIKEDLETTKKTIEFEKRTEEDLNQNIHSHIDTHLHSKYSLDGYLDIEQLVKRAKENSVDFISITDHNSVQAFHDLMRSEKKADNEIIYDYDGVKILCGSEVTCYMQLDEEHKIKFHLLCYGFDRSDKSHIMDLITTKYDDYKRSQYALLYYLIKKDEVYQTSLTEIRSYMRDYVDKHEFSGDINKSFAINFYLWKGINEEKIHEDVRDFNEAYKRRDKFKLDIIDVINATHQDGGLCSLAHPTVSIEKFRRKKHVAIDSFTLCKRVTQTLLFAGLDGIEIANKTSPFDIQYNDFFKDTYLVSCGSDLHYFNEVMYKDVGKYRNNVSHANIDTVMLELEKAKKAGQLTKHQVTNKYIFTQDTRMILPYMHNNHHNHNGKFNQNHRYNHYPVYAYEKNIAKGLKEFTFQENQKPKKKLYEQTTLERFIDEDVYSRQ
ncbi:MAG: PHP domain-containing protein [Clostridia bacterium]|nr:PHP domain-containing protein [Clostridia bacterium]